MIPLNATLNDIQFQNWSLRDVLEWFARRRDKNDLSDSDKMLHQWLLRAYHFDRGIEAARNALADADRAINVERA